MILERNGGKQTNLIKLQKIVPPGKQMGQPWGLNTRTSQKHLSCLPPQEPFTEMSSLAPSWVLVDFNLNISVVDMVQCSLDDEQFGSEIPSHCARGWGNHPWDRIRRVLLRRCCHIHSWREWNLDPNVLLFDGANITNIILSYKRPTRKNYHNRQHDSCLQRV